VTAVVLHVGLLTVLVDGNACPIKIVIDLLIIQRYLMSILGKHLKT